MEERLEHREQLRKKIFRWVITIGIVLLVFLFFRAQRNNLFQLYNYLFKPRTELGHIQITDLSKTAKLKVLTMYKEIIVSQYRQERGFLFSQNEYQIHSIYPGRLDIGFDLTKCEDDWIVTDGDTVIVSLPPVEILNKDAWYIDETKKQTPIEDGSWNNADYNTMAQRANALMRRTCELEDCYKQAETQGFKVVANLFKSFGYQNLKINIKTRDNYKPYHIVDADAAKYANPYQFYTGTDGSSYIHFSNGANLHYKGNFTQEELLSFIDLFNQFTIDEPVRLWNIQKQGSSLSIGMTQEIPYGTTQTAILAQNVDQGRIIRIKNAAAMICPKERISISILDRNGETIRVFN